MVANARGVAVGVDVGTEYVKTVVLDPDGRVLGRSVIPTRGYFQACAYEGIHAALADAQTAGDSLVGIGATGFGMSCVPQATRSATESACHAMGAYHHLGHAMTLVNIGGRQPEVISVDGAGRRTGTRGARGCAVGVGSFLMFAARHLDVSPARLDELAAAAERAALVSSYCSVFSATAVLERLREGATREDVALGCLMSIAERVAEIGGLEAPIVISGGVAEYFPGVLRALESLATLPVLTIPDPMFTGAVGAALLVFRTPAAVA
jgi:predicted CoA-substrate-specific enzyme activase